MNLSDLLEKLWQVTGYPDTTSDRQDWRLQTYKDALNTTLDEICATCSPMLFALQRESTLSLVQSTSLYTLDDWCQRVLSIWTEDIAAHKVRYIRPRTADANGMRNSQFVYPPLGPYCLTDGMRTPTALVSGASGSSTGASVSEGSTTVTFGSSGTALTSALNGKMIRFNGEAADYVFTQTGAHAGTVDRPVAARITGVGTTNVGSGYTNVRWEISPPLRVRLKILPTPTVPKTIYYRYMANPRKMVNASDAPEIQEEYHHLLWKGALRLIAAEKQNQEMLQMWQGEYLTALSELQKSDVDDFDSSDSPAYETLESNIAKGIPAGVYTRSGGGYVTQGNYPGGW